MNVSLGGPGPGCSATRVRRLAAGELAPPERARVEEHLLGCARCAGTLREIEEERRGLAAALPFDAFAAGVAERLARPPPRRERWGRAVTRFVPLALAASVALGVGVPLVARLTAREDANRVKGGAALTVYVDGAGGPRALAPGEPVPPGARLRVAVGGAAGRQLAVALVDRDGVAVVYAGPAVAGPLPGAFEWTGEGDGALVAVLDGRPVDAAALEARLGRGGVGAASPGGRAEVVIVRLARRAR